MRRLCFPGARRAALRPIYSDAFVSGLVVMERPSVGICPGRSLFSASRIIELFCPLWFSAACLPLGYVTGAAETGRDLCSQVPFRRISDVHWPAYSIWHQQQAGRMLRASDYLLAFA